MLNKEIKKTIIKELREVFEFKESGVKERIQIDLKKQEITVKFNYKIDVEGSEEFITFI